LLYNGSVRILFVFAASLFAVQHSAAEFLSIEQRFGGIVCGSCAESLQKSFSRLRGVESVQVNMEEGVARLTLRPGNRVRLEDIRDRIKAVGFTPAAAQVKAEGSVLKQEGAWRLSLDANTQNYFLPLAASGAQTDSIAKAEGRMVTVSGGVASGEMTLTVTSLEEK
jgi:cation transport ATPase